MGEEEPSDWRRRGRIAGGVDAEPPTSIHIHGLPNDLLERILERVGTAVSLIRAAATCKPWRRVIVGGGFLRRFRRVNGPHVLGHYYHYCRGVRPVFFPLGVGKGDVTVKCLGVFLLDAGPGESETGTGLNMSNFRLLCVHLVSHCHDDSKTVQTCVFSAGDGRWLSLSARVIGDIIPGIDIFPVPFVLVGRAGGSICWSIDGHCSNVVLHLNENTGEFSYLRLPGINRVHNRRNLRVIGTVHLARIVGNDLEALRFVHGGGACMVERRTGLSGQEASIESRPWYFSDTAPEAAAPGCILLCDGECHLEYIWTFSVDTQNMQQERVQKLKPGDGRAFPYELPWPPSFSACLCDE